MAQSIATDLLSRLIVFAPEGDAKQRLKTRRCLIFDLFFFETLLPLLPVQLVSAITDNVGLGYRSGRLERRRTSARWCLDKAVALLARTRMLLSFRDGSQRR